jgi:hypothetical protein
MIDDNRKNRAIITGAALDLTLLLPLPRASSRGEQADHGQPAAVFSDATVQLGQLLLVAQVPLLEKTAC